MIDLRSLSRRVLNTLLPIDCASCGVALTNDPVSFFCATCWGAIRPLRGPVCPRCGRPFSSTVALQYSPNHLCGDCRSRPPAFTAARSLYPYDSSLRDAIHLVKYRGKVALTSGLADLMKGAWREIPGLELVIPVPLHPARLTEREFNQALLLADHLAGWLGVPISYNNLVRVRATAPQTDLTRAQRKKNLRRSFVLRHPREVAGKRILLLDDVFTTGTTVNECAKALRKAGSADVYVVTLARTL